MEYMKKLTKIHIRLDQSNAEMVLKLSRNYNISYTKIVNQLLSQIEISKIVEEETKETITTKRIILK